MANVEHSSLTGSDLHEPKGVAAASANRVYVADGAGSGTWTTVSNDVLASSAKAFQAQLLHVRDKRTSGTSGDTYTSGAFRTKTLQTVVTNEISGASLASNQITLPAGTYYIDASAIVAVASAQHQMKLRNVSDSTDALYGQNAYSNHTGGFASTPAFLKGRFTIASAKTFELQHRVTVTTGATNANSYSTEEIYTDILIWKVA